MVPYVDTVVSVTVMCVLLFVLYVCLLRECDGVRWTAMLVWGWMRCGDCRACGFCDCDVCTVVCVVCVSVERV